MVFDQCINHERVTVNDFAVVERLPGNVSFPKVAAVLRVAKVAHEKLIALLGGLEVIATPAGEPLSMHVSKGPDHASLRDELLFRGDFAPLNVVGEEIAPVLGISGAIDPIGEEAFAEELLIFAGVLDQRCRRHGLRKDSNAYDECETHLRT